MNYKTPAIYILASKRNGTLYTGVTSNLEKRTMQHKAKLASGFTKKYSCSYLVYFEHLSSMQDAINREKQIKAGSRYKKIKLIESLNPNWLDLYNMKEIK
jgi:putative endonuclease